MSERDDFFVGYLPTTASLSRWLRRWSFATLIAAFAMAVAIASRQRDPGDGAWDTEHVVTLNGTIMERPYPMLALSGDGPNQDVVLLVSTGKFGASNRVRGLHGKQAQVRGYRLQRGNRTLLELSDADDVIKTIGEGSTPSAIQPLNSIELSGEIVDPKCFAGAMKPGIGKTHKACAALCLRGGIPPMFLTEHDSYLLVNSSAAPLDGQNLADAIAYVGQPVTLHGRLAQLGNLPILLVDRITPN